MYLVHPYLRGTQPVYIAPASTWVARIAGNPLPLQRMRTNGALDVFTKMLLVLVLVGGGGSRTDSVSYSWFIFLFAIQIFKSFSKTRGISSSTYVSLLVGVILTIDTSSSSHSRSAGFPLHRFHDSSEMRAKLPRSSPRHISRHRNSLMD